jgi:hypothetical protein
MATNEELRNLEYYYYFTSSLEVIKAKNTGGYDTVKRMQARNFFKTQEQAEGVVQLISTLLGYRK